MKIRPYWWRAQARDNENATSGWTDSSAFFVSTVNDAPTAPRISDPFPGEKVTTLFPSLEVFNSTDSDLDVVTYFFEIDSAQTFDSVELEQSAEIEEGAGSTTAWQPSETVENTNYYWRARAFDGAAYSEWSKSWFLVNLENEGPPAVTIKNPGDRSEVTTLTPVLQVHPATDPNQDPVTYDYQVYADAGLSNTVASTQGAGTSWQLDISLADNTTYYWQARAVDDQGALGQWTTAVSFFVNTANERPEAPALNNPLSGGTVTHLTPTLSVNNSLNRDLDDITYEFELFTDQNLFTKLAVAEVPQGGPDYLLDGGCGADGQHHLLLARQGQRRRVGQQLDVQPRCLWCRPPARKQRQWWQRPRKCRPTARPGKPLKSRMPIIRWLAFRSRCRRVRLTEDCTITISQVINPPALPADIKAIGKVIELGPSGTTFLTELTIMIPYTPADLDAAGASDPAELEVYTYNTSAMVWEKISVAGVDITRKLFTLPH